MQFQTPTEAEYTLKIFGILFAEAPNTNGIEQNILPIRVTEFKCNCWYLYA